MFPTPYFLSSPPMQWMYHGVTPVELAALYNIADALIVSSLRDGMNLTALEYVFACQHSSFLLFATTLCCSSILLFALFFSFEDTSHASRRPALLAKDLACCSFPSSPAPRRA
jgi:trehalose-6-phosphate synthase